MQKIKPGKKAVFYSVLIALPFLFVIGLELILRLFSYGDDLRLFIQASDQDYLKCNPIVSKRFFSKFENTTPLNDQFLEIKPENGFRIFVLGESTAEGFPYDANLAFSRILQHRLQDIFHDRKIEVINLGMTAINSYSLLDFSDELLQQKPDAVLIYTGHNEYYGALGVASMESGSIPGWLKKLHLRLIHLKTYQLLQSSIGSIYKAFSPTKPDEAKGTLMQRIVGRNVIPYGSEMYQEGLMQFHENISRLLEKFKDAKVAVIISDQVSNIRDLPPFKTVKDVSYPSADSLYNDAKKLEADSLYDKAKEKYTAAKDMDAIRFRASEDLNKIIFQLADSLGCYKLSLKSIFEKNSPGYLVGDNLMTDHLHPNITGYFLMADGFLNALKEHGLIEKEWDSTRIKPWQFYRYNWGYTELDSTIASLRIKNLKSGWPFKPDTTVNNFIFTYKPNSVTDSIAFMAVKYVNVGIEKVHKDLAAYYRRSGEPKRASKEYLALAYIYPYNASFYYHAADLANEAKDYESVISILEDSPNADTSAYAQLTLASVFYSQKKYKEALLCSDKLKNINVSESNKLISEKLRYNIEKDSGLTTEAENTLSTIKKNEPEFNEKKKSKTTLVLIPEKIRPYIENAEKYRRAGNLSEAYNLVTKANSIQETSFGNLLAGKILLSQNNFKDALAYMEKAYVEVKDDPTLVYNLSLLYMMKGDLDKAAAAMKNFEKLEGTSSPRYKQLQSVYSKVLSKRK